MRAIEAVTTPGETAALCHSVGVSRASLYRRRCSTCCTTSGSSTNRPPKSMPRCSRSSGTSVPRAQCIVCSRAAKEVRERRAQARHPVYAHPSSWRCARIRSGRGTSPNSRPPLLLAVRHPRPLQPLRGGLDGRAPGECSPGGAPDCGDLPEAGRALPRTNSPFMRTAARPCGASSSRGFSQIWASPPVIRGTARAWRRTPPILSGSCRGHHVQKRCPRPCGSIGRRNRRARMPQERRP